jgi:hypothetical protein
VKGKTLVEDMAVDGKIICKEMLKKWNGRMWAWFIWLKMG